MKTLNSSVANLNKRSVHPIADELSIDVDKRLQIVLYLQHLLGISPLTRADKRYYFKWFSLPTARCSITALFFMFINIIFVTHEAMGILFLFDSNIRVSISKIERALWAEYGKNAETLLSVFYFVTILQATFEILMPILSWSSSTKFKGYLNEWKRLQQDFQEIFPSLSLKNSRLKTKSIRWSSVLLTSYVVAPSLGCLPFLALVLDHYSYFLLDYTLFGVVFVSRLFCQLLEDVKVILICFHVADAFRKIRLGIEESLTLQEPKQSTVHSWRRLISDVKKQNDLAGECLQGTELASIVFTISIGTALLYAGLNTPLSSRVGLGVAGMATSFCSLLFLRLFIKAAIAERITKEEANLTRYLILIDSTSFPDSIFIQIKATVDWVASCPSTMNFGNFVILNKRLFLGVFGQVITYLIVLMQYYQGEVT